MATLMLAFYSDENGSIEVGAGCAACRYILATTPAECCGAQGWRFAAA